MELAIISCDTAVNISGGSFESFSKASELEYRLESSRLGNEVDDDEDDVDDEVDFEVDFEVEEGIGLVSSVLHIFSIRLRIISRSILKSQAAESQGAFFAAFSTRFSLY